ncbi:cellulase family glycosylhydrolase [Mycolicibacterium sp. J2]|uniref:cellulase family glycosylhydrolase n=1 Tax=Mycolicibacterium sp. J2 TaxID=2993511 RepID=UPI00224A848E|nr:cellulase family glycosylhydrolase [Mycolicibacterium sp. J2]MCX2713887.1 cellulase family glycosylhydrolase [Mycolicibacterium sp. J2]
MFEHILARARSMVIRALVGVTAASVIAATGSHFVIDGRMRLDSSQIELASAIDDSSSTVGISDSSLYFTTDIDAVNAQLDLMKSLGVTNVRIMIPWAGVQPLDPDLGSPWGDAQWGQMDMVVNAARAKGMGILGVLNSTPWWATESTPINGHPADVNEFASFAKSVALRYGDAIQAYEVWNEPNAAFFWNPVDPVEYTNMLKVTYVALKQASAQIGAPITVIGAVVGAGLTWGDVTMNPVDFVQAMYAAGANGYFDALSFHPYKYDLKFSEGNTVPWYKETPLYQVEQLRQLIDSYLAPGQEQLKIWISEYGLPTNQVSEDQQMAYIQDLIQYWQTFSGAGPIFLYTTKDSAAPDEDLTNDEAHFGLFNSDGTPKAVALLLKQFIESLQPSPPTEPVPSLLDMIGQLIKNVLTFIPNLVVTVVKSVVDAVGQLFKVIGQLVSGLTGQTVTATTAVSAARVSNGSPLAADDAVQASAPAVRTDLTEAQSSNTATGTAAAGVVADPVAPDAIRTEVTAADDAPASAEQPPAAEDPATSAPSASPVPATAEPVGTVTTAEPAEPAKSTESAEAATSRTDDTTEVESSSEATVSSSQAVTAKVDTAEVDTAKVATPKAAAPKPATTTPDAAAAGKGATGSTGPGTKPRHPARDGKSEAGPKPVTGDLPRTAVTGAPPANSSHREETGSASATTGGAAG